MAQATLSRASGFLFAKVTRLHNSEVIHGVPLLHRQYAASLNFRVWN